jgi:hypothetical protein
MGKSVNPAVLDAAHNVIINGADKMTICSAEPTTYQEATVDYMLAEIAMVPGDYTLADGDGTPPGRKTTVAAKQDNTISNNGEATHVALVDTVNSTLLRVTTCDSLTLVSGQTVNVGSWLFDIDGPV